MSRIPRMGLAAGLSFTISPEPGAALPSLEVFFPEKGDTI